ncbi:MFS transporter [Bacillus sp. OK048]|uniref:MFS transporter n=1 Tax=Bacillus sp. OK048 TaxID=1882761 RepID=UPI000889129F|nr:MFS transporter [Bacillus sp. OK048]SDL94800.1 Major Facilitator Superfamily protein [Bacillus sp. OK048]
MCSFSTKSTVKEEKERPQATIKEPFYKYMFDKRVLLPCILVTFNYIAIAGTVNFMGAFGKENNVGGRISQFFIAQGNAMVIVRAFSGKIFDRFGHRILIIPAAISGAAGLILLGFSTSMVMVLVSGALFGIVFAIIHPIIQAWALTLVPPEKKATANSMLLIFIDFGLAIGLVGLGFLDKSVGYGMTFSYSAAFMIIILLLYLIGSKKTVTFEAKKEKSRTKHTSLRTVKP